MVLLITATVNPSSKIMNLTLKDNIQRLIQYKQCLAYYLINTKINNIVLCDNSEVCISEFDNEVRIAKDLNKNLEILSFKGSEEYIIKYGKGYGEGEIIEYSISNSILLKTNEYFFKATGRLKLINIDKIILNLNKKSNLISINRSIGTCAVDSRFYSISINLYIKYFLYSYKNVNDSKGFFLEHVFYSIILKNKIKTSCFYLYPRVSGISGSTGFVYNDEKLTRKVKLFFRDLLSKFGYYTISL